MKWHCNRQCLTLVFQGWEASQAHIGSHRDIKTAPISWAHLPQIQAFLTASINTRKIRKQGLWVTLTRKHPHNFATCRKHDPWLTKCSAKPAAEMRYSHHAQRKLRQAQIEFDGDIKTASISLAHSSRTQAFLTPCMVEVDFCISKSVKSVFQTFWPEPSFRISKSVKSVFQIFWPEPSFRISKSVKSVFQTFWQEPSFRIFKVWNLYFKLSGRNLVFIFSKFEICLSRLVIDPWPWASTQAPCQRTWIIRMQAVKTLQWKERW